MLALVFPLIVVPSVLAGRDVVLLMEQIVDDHVYSVSENGHAKSCGPEGTNIDLSWSPKNVTKGGVVKFELHMTSPIDMEDGNGNITIYQAQYPNIPMMSFSFNGKCQDVIRYGASGLKCPIKKKDSINMHMTIRQFTDRFLPGHYFIHLNVTSTSDNWFGCVQMEVFVSGPKFRN